MSSGKSTGKGMMKKTADETMTGGAVGRVGAWGKGLAARALQVAVVVAVTSSVPAAWSANKGAPASVTAASTPNLHVNKVAAGSASFLNTGNLTTVTTGSARTIINYQYLSVPAGTTLDFVQPSVNSRVLNRIEGNAPTAIEGALTSNANVYLVNPAGVIFGKGAVVTVGKFFAAAAHMSDADFLAGNDHFTGGSGAVTNYGTITADQVHLVGASVANFGEIIAPASTTGGGVVTMTAGKDVYIGESSSATNTPHVLVKVSADTSAQAAGTGVTNSGSITAGQIRLGAGDLYAAGIYSNGVLKGKEITMNSGASSDVTTGIVDASSATGQGGNVQILGDKVGVFGGTVTASGKTSGGTVLIGGALHGGGGVQVATDTVISSGATVSADGTASKADGGTVVVFSSAWTKVDGAISATGGEGGLGGFVETSSHNQLSVGTAPSIGQGGTWLMDPTDVQIDVANANETPTTANGTTTFDPSNDAATVSATAINLALSTGTSVTINTTSTAATAGILGNITFAAPLVIATTIGTPTLTLNASGNIKVQASDGITTTGAVGLTVNFNAGGTTTINENISTNGGTFTSTGAGFSLAAGNISTGGGDVILRQTGGTVSITGNITTGVGKFWSTGTDFTNSGTISSTSAISILHTGNVSLGGDVNAGGAGSLSIAGVSVVQTAGVVTAGTAAIQTTGDNGSASKYAVKLDGVNPIGALAISSTGAGAIVDVATSGASNVSNTLALTGAPALFPGFGAVTGITTANGSVSVSTGGALAVNSAIGTANGTVALTSAGNMTVGAAINAGTGNANLTASTGDINGSGSVAITAANVTLTATAGGVGIGQGVTVTSGANVAVVTGGTDAAGDATFGFTGVAHTGDITLSDTAGSQTGLTYTITSGGNFIINGNFGTSTESLNITASSGGISETGGFVLTADKLVLTATGAGMGSAGNAIGFADSTSANFTAGGDIYISGNLNKPVTFGTDATPRTIAVIDSGSMTVGTNLDAGANNTLIVDGNTGVTLGAGKTLSGGTVYVVSGGDVALAGNVSSSGTVMLRGNTVTGAGVISGSQVGAEATGILTGVSINLSSVSSSGNIAASGPVTLGGTVAIGTTGDAVIGNVAAFSPAGFTGFAALSGVKGNGNNVAVTAAGNITLAQDVDGGLLGNATVNANGTTSSIVESGGVVGGLNVALLASGGIGANGTPVQVSSLGGIALTTAGVNHTGDMFVQINNAVSLGSLVVTSNLTTVQTVSIAQLANLSLTGAVTFGNDDVGLSGTNLSLSSGHTIAAGNVTLSATNGTLSINGDVSGGTGGFVTLTATGGDLAIAGNVSSGTGGTISMATTAGNISQTGGSISTSGGNITANAVGGSLSIGGTAITVGTGTLSLTGATGVSQTAGTIGAAGGNVSVNAAGGNISLGGTVSAAGGAVSITGNAGITGGNITAATLVVSGGGGINLTGNTVGTVAAAGNGTVNFTDSGGLSIGQIGSITGVSSGNGSITVQDGTGAIALTQAVNAGTGNATVHAASNITGVAGSNGTVTGNVVTLTAGTGDLGTSGTVLKTSSSDLVLSGGNIYVAEANSIGSTAASRLSANVGSGDILSLSAPLFIVTTTFGSATSGLSLHATGGAITTSNGSLTGTSITLNASAAIGASGSELTIAPGAATTMSFTAVNGVFVTSTTALDLGHVTVSSPGQGIEFIAPTMSTTSGNFTATGGELLLKTTTAGAGLTLTNTIAAADITLITDNIVSGTGTFTANGGAVEILPFTTGRAINMSNGVLAGDLNIGEAVLQHTDAATVQIGDNSTSGTMVVGPMNLASAVFDLSLHTSGQYNFQGTLTLQNDKTFTLAGASSIVNGFAGTDIAIGGTGTLVISSIGGDIGTLANPLTTAIAQLGGVTGTGHLFISNTGALDVTGAINMTAGGVATGNVIATHSPLSIDAPIVVVGDLTLAAGDNAAAMGDTLTVNSSVGATGNIALQAGDGIVLNSGIIASNGSVSINANHELSLTDGDNGTVVQSGLAGIQAGSVSVTAATGISLGGSNNKLTTITATNSTSGNISITDNNSPGANLSIGSITSTVSGGVVSVVAATNITEGGAITTANGSLIAKTLNNSGAVILLTNAGNNLGSGLATLQTRNAADTATAAADVSFTTSSQMHLQQIQSGANVTLSATTIDQSLSDSVGIHAATLTVSSSGATILTSGHNDFSTLNVSDGSSGGLLQYATHASGGLTITGLTQVFGGTANITNSSGAVNSSIALDQQNLNVVAVGGIALTSNSNVLQSVTANNTSSGDITIHEGAFLPLTVTALAQSGGGVTNLTSADGITLAGTINAGAGLTATSTNAGGVYTATSAAVITSSGAVVIVADQMAIDPGSSLTATGQQITLKPLTLSENIAINGADGAGQLGLLNNELATLKGAQVTIGAYVGPANAGNETGNVLSSGTFDLPTNVRFITTGNVDLSGATITTNKAGSQQLEVDHGGTLALGTATIDGGLTEFSANGSGAGGIVSLSGTLSTPDHGISFVSPVALAGDESITTVGVTGADVTFGNAGSSVSGTHNLTLTAGTGNISFSSAAGNGTPLAALQIVSANNVTTQAVTVSNTINVTASNVSMQAISAGGTVSVNAGNVTFQTVNALGESVTNSGTFTINGTQTLGAGGFVQLSNGALSSIALNADITTRGAVGTGPISVGSNMSFTGDRTLDSTTANATTGGLITLNGNVTGTGNLTLLAGASNVAINSSINIGGVFAARGAGFINTAAITSGGFTIVQSGSAQIDGPLADGSNTVSIDAVGITSNGTGSIDGGTITLTAHSGNVTLGAPVTGSGAFTSTGVDFKNNVGATITAHGISILHTGVVDIAANLTSIGANVTTTGSTITVEQGAIVMGNVVDMPATVGVFINDQVIAPTGYSSSGNTPFTITSTGSITTSGANALIDYPLGLVTIQGPINTGTGSLQINGKGIFSSGIGTITSGNITLAAGTGNVTLEATVTGSGFFTSSGANFTNNATVSVVGANLTHTGPVTLNANFTGNGGNVSISGVGILSNVSGTLGGNAITLAGGTSNVTLGGAVNGNGLLTVTGANFLNTANVSTVGANISMPSGAVNFNAPISSGTGDLLVTSTTVTSNANGTIGGANITLNETGAVTLGATVTGTGNLVSNGTTFSGIDLSAVNITLNHTGLVTFNGNVTANSGTGDVQVTGAGLTQVAGIVDSGTLTLLGTGTFTLTDANTVDTLAANITGPLTYVNGGNLVVGTAGTAPTIGISTHGGALSLTVNSGDLTVASVINAGAGAISFVTSAGSEHVNANVTTSSTFSSNGTNFTSNATITANGITLAQTGPVTLNGAIEGGTSLVSITGAGITSTVSGTIDSGTLTLTAGTGDTALAGTINASGSFTSTGANFTNTASITSVGANITHTGTANIDGALADGTSAVLIDAHGITSDANGTIDAGTVTLTAGTGDEFLSGTITASGLFISTGANFTNNAEIQSAGANITQTALVMLNGALEDGTSAVNINGVGITSTANGTIDGGTITLGAGTGSTTLNGAITGSGLFTSTGGAFTNNSSVTTAGATITSTGAVNIDGGLFDSTNPILITGIGISSNANGTMQAGNVTLVGQSGDVSLAGVITATGFFQSTGANFTNTANITSAGANVTHSGPILIDGQLIDGSSDVLLHGPGITSTVNGIITAGNVTLTAGGSDVVLHGDIHATGLLLSTGANFTNTGNLTSAGATITHTGSATVDGALIDTGSPIAIDAVGISSTANGTMSASTVTLTAHSGDVSLAGTITATGLFTSTGANFTNTANITSAGANITHTGTALVDGALLDGGNAILIDAVGITSTTRGSMTAGPVTLTAHSGDVLLNGVIDASGLFTSTGKNFTNNAGITSAGATITHNGSATINGSLVDTGNPIAIDAYGITSTSNGTMSASTVTLTAHTGDVSLAGTINATGLFSSTGVNFTNTASITSGGANITHTGAANIDGALVDGSSNILIDAIGITSNSNGTMQAGNVTLTAHSGNVSLAGTITATGFFQSTGANFTNTANITSAGANVTHTGSALIDGALNDGNNAVLIDAVGIISTANGSMTTGALTLTAHSGDISLAGVIHASGLFTSTGAAFINTANITSVGANITQTGAVQIHAALDASGQPVNIIGLGISSNVAGTIAGSTITLTGGVGDVNLAGNVTGTGLFTSTGAAFTNTGSITSAGANITHTGAVNIDGALIDGSSNINIDGAGITSNTNGTMDGGAITLTGHAGDVILAGTIHGSGLFTSTGAAFTNTASITSAGANITHTGAANIDGALVDGVNPIFINAIGITSNANGTMQAGNITLTAHSGNVALAGTITASGFFHSTGANFTNTANITSAGANITHTGSALIDGALADGGNAILIDAIGITSTTRGSMTAGPVTLTAHSGDVSLAGTINASGLFTSTGVGFLNTASITSAGANLTHTGLVQIQGALLDGNSPINIIGNGITSSVAGTMNAGPITLTGGSGNVILAGNINASGLFTSTGAAFTNTGSISSAGANITHSGAVNIDGALADGANAITITGAGITSNSSGTMNAGPITLTGGSGAVTLAGTITASGLFTSTGAAFTNTASITSAGALLTHTGAVNIDGALIDGSNAVTITGHGIASNSSGPITAGNITLTAGSGDVSLAGTIHGSGFFKSTGAGFLNTATITVAGANLTHTGFVQIHNALDSTGNAVTITGQGIDSNTAGTINATTLALNSLGGDATLSGNILATGAFTSTGIGFTNNGTISAVGITLTHSGAVTINNTMDAHTGAISVTGASSINDPASTLTGVGVTLHAGGPVTVGNTINAGTGPALLTSDSSSVTDTGDILASVATITAATNATVSNITTTNGNISVLAPAASLRGNLLAGTGNVLVSGTSNLVNDVTVVGTTATFGGSITGGGKSLTINASGLTSLGGDVGTAGSPLANILTDAPGTTTLHGSAYATGNLFILDPLTLTANSQISGGTVKFGGTIVGGGVSLAVTSSHLSDFAGTIGAGTGNALTSFSVSGGTATFHGASITTTGAETFNALVVLANSLVATGTAFTFGTTIDSLSAAAPAGLTIIGNGPLVLSGDIGSTGILASFISTGSTGTGIAHPITTTGNISIAGPITIGTTLKSTAGNVSLPGTVALTGNTNVIANGAGGITFGLGGITGNKNLTFTSNANGSKTAVGAIGTGTAGRIGNLTFNSAGVTSLGGNIFAQNVKFGYKDGGPSPTFNPTIATIYYAKGDLVINTNGTFDMEQNQSLSVFAAPTTSQGTLGAPTGIGNLSIISNNHPVFLGDISAQGTVTINTGDVHQLINIRARPGVQVTLSDGSTLNSPAVGITSGLTTPHALILTGTLNIVTATGTLNQVYFSSGAATVDIANTVSLQLGDVTKILDFNRTNVLTGKNFLSSTGLEVLQQVPTGLGLPPQNQVNVAPRDIQTLQPERAAAISGALKDALQEIGIYARDVRTDELIEYLVGTALYDDVPYKLDPSPQDMTVAANRLPYAPVLPTVDAYRALFLKPELDANGKPVLDDKGKPKMAVQNTIILNTFGQTWLAYKMAMKEKATPDGFRGWLEANVQANKKNEAALSYLDQLRDLLNQIRSLGLTSAEFDGSKNLLLSKVRPPNMKEADFLTAIMGPSTRARTMTAMRNGEKHPGRG